MSQLRAVEATEAPRLTPGTWATLPPMVRVLVVAGLGSGGFAGAAEVLGLQTTAAAAADRKAISAEIAAVAGKQQVSDQVEARNHVEVTNGLEATRAAQSRLEARLEQLLGRRRGSP
ncbi:MAG TPA: hypothetical protein VJV75_03770 [Candidatus Polarisedimenticolia bacterium]|nr:hypothetical protein [Candidatus Polarisedimenticolia bacterium]